MTRERLSHRPKPFGELVIPSKGGLSPPPITEATHAVFLRRDMQSNAQVNTDVGGVCL